MRTYASLQPRPVVRDLEAHNEAVKNSFQDLGAASGGFHDNLAAWFWGFETFKSNLHQLLLNIIDKLKDAALEATVGRSLQSDAVQMCMSMGLATNPKQPPASVQGPHQPRRRQYQIPSQLLQVPSPGSANPAAQPAQAGQPVQIALDSAVAPRTVSALSADVLAGSCSNPVCLHCQDSGKPGI